VTRAASNFIPPAPIVYPKDLPTWRLLWNVSRSSLTIWPDYAFETMSARNRVLGIDTLLSNDPEAVRHVMMSNATNYRRPVSVRRVTRPLGGEGLFLAEGANWRRQRRLLAPTFAPASIKLLLPHFQEAGLHLLHMIERTGQANLSSAFQETALEAVLRALFSMPENLAREKLSHLVRDYVEGSGRPSLLDGLARSEDSFAFANLRRKRFQHAWFAGIDAVIAERRVRSADGDQRDLLDLLLRIEDAGTGEALSSAEIRDQCATMFFAGSETTARLMFWATYLLTQDAEEQDKVRAEIAAFSPEQARDLADLQNWPRLRNLLLETLRLYPPVPHIIRDAIASDEIAGEKVTAGTQVWFSAWVMHRHRKFWDRPTAFVPDRFADKSTPWTQMTGYMPFGAGPRICIGLHFALSEALIVLAMLFARYRISLSGSKPVLPIGRVTIEPSYEPAFRLEAA
jgi:cytochrome P450